MEQMRAAGFPEGFLWEVLLPHIRLKADGKKAEKG